MYPRNSFLPSSTLKGGSAPEDLQPLSAAANNSLLDIPKAGNKGLDGAFRLILGTITGIFDLDMKLSEFEKWGSIRVLSSPNISTLDNNPARIEQVVSIPLMDGSAAGIKDKLVDTNLTFEITPNVTNDKKVLMEIEVTDNYPDPSITEKGGQSVIRKNKVGTQILAMGGETVVVRCLFTNIEAVDKQNEFFVFLTPWIIK
jgi:type II secretory pathway component HofQ